MNEETTAAHEHVRGCADCRAYLLHDEVSRSTGRSGSTGGAPPELRERIVRAVERRRRGELLGDIARHATWLAAVVFVVGGTLLFGRSLGHTSSGNPPDVFVEDYMRRAVGQDHIETSDATEVTRFLQRELGLDVRPLTADTLTLERAEICLLEGRRGAMIVYKLDGAVVSHYLLPRENVDERPPALSRRAGAVASELPVVTWAADRVEQALVGEVAPEVLVALASGS